MKELVDILTGVHDVLVEMNKEINKLTQEVIKLNERIEDATTRSNSSWRREP